MKKCVLVSALFVFASLLGFASAKPASTKSAATTSSHAQPKASNQFRVKHSQLSHKSSNKNSKSSTPAADPRAGFSAWQSKFGQATQATHAAAAISASKSPFATRAKSNTSSTTSVNFVTAARFPLAGTDDDHTEGVMGNFAGNGNMGIAKVVSNVVSSTTTYQIAVLLGNGDGTFQTAVMTNTPNNTDDMIVVGDVNGDGKDDLVMVHPEGATCDAAALKLNARQSSNCSSNSSFDVLISNGDGTFTEGNNYSLGNFALTGGILTDVNGDGNLDVMVIDTNNPADVIVSLGNGDGTFQAETTYATLSGASPDGPFFADFNGDGKIDFAGDVEGQIQVYLASGSGFASPVSEVTSDAAYNSCFNTAGDLTGDGKPEIVSVNCNVDTLTIYVNNGDGTFQTGVYYDSNGNQYQYPTEATIADVNDDGNADIVVGNVDSGDITVFLGHGDGSVTVQPVSYATGGYPWNTPLVADFNGDGLMDIVMSDDLYNIVYLEGYGDGTFRSAPNYDLPNSFSQESYTFSVASGDFNGDGIPDVVVGQWRNDSSTGITVYLAKGDGTFYPGVSYGTSQDMGYVAVGDFNGDGKLDIAATDPDNGIVQIFLGNGDGTFNIAGAYPTDTNEERYPENVVVGDFNHDKKLDLAIADPGSGVLGVLLGNGDGTFQAPATYPIMESFSAPYFIATADVNGDGYLDLEALGVTDGPPFVAILLANNDNSGTFNAPTYITLNGDPNWLTFGDLNNDGKLDMAITIYGGTYDGDVEIALGNGDGTFQAPTDYPSSAFDGGLGDSYPASIQMFDWNGDGNLDLVYENADTGTVAVALGNGDGTIAAPVEFPSTTYTWGMTLADVNNDGAMDVVIGNDETGGMNVLLNGNGSGVAPNYTFGTQTPSQSVAAGASGTYTLNLAGTFGYNGTITFACSGLPTATACTFSPTSVTAQGNVPLTTTLTITTTASTSATLLGPGPSSKPGEPILLASLGGMGLFGLLLAGSGKKGRQHRAHILFAAALLVTLGTLIACGSNGTTATGTTPPPPTPVVGTPAGSYAVTVTSTGTGSSAPTHNVVVTLVVQ